MLVCLQVFRISAGDGGHKWLAGFAAFAALLLLGCGGADRAPLSPSQPAIPGTVVMDTSPRSALLGSTLRLFAHATGGSPVLPDTATFPWQGGATLVGDTLVIRLGVSVRDDALQPNGSYVQRACVTPRDSDNRTLRRPACVLITELPPRIDSLVAAHCKIVQPDTLVSVGQTFSLGDAVLVKIACRDHVFTQQSSAAGFLGTRFNIYPFFDGVDSSNFHGGSALSPDTLAFVVLVNGGYDATLGLVLVNPVAAGIGGGSMCLNLPYKGPRGVPLPGSAWYGCPGTGPRFQAGAASLKFLLDGSVPIGPLGTVRVEVDDTLGVLVGTSSQTIQVSITNNVSGGILSGGLSNKASFGVATFTDLSFDRVGNFTLVANASDPQFRAAQADVQVYRPFSAPAGQLATGFPADLIPSQGVTGIISTGQEFWDRTSVTTSFFASTPSVDSFRSFYRKWATDRRWYVTEDTILGPAAMVVASNSKSPPAATDSNFIANFYGASISVWFTYALKRGFSPSATNVMTPRRGGRTLCVPLPASAGGNRAQTPSVSCWHR